MALVVLATYYNSFEAGVVRGLLASHDIESALFDFNVAMEGPSMLVPIRLMVDEDDLALARRLLEESAP